MQLFNKITKIDTIHTTLPMQHLQSLVLTSNTITKIDTIHMSVLLVFYLYNLVSCAIIKHGVLWPMLAIYNEIIPPGFSKLTILRNRSMARLQTLWCVFHPGQFFLEAAIYKNMSSKPTCTKILTKMRHTP